MSQPDYVPVDFEANRLDTVISDLIRIGVYDIGISGHGETTFLPNWQVHASKLNLRRRGRICYFKPSERIYIRGIGDSGAIRRDCRQH